MLIDYFKKSKRVNKNFEKKIQQSDGTNDQQPRKLKNHARSTNYVYVLYNTYTSHKYSYSVCTTAELARIVRCSFKIQPPPPFQFFFGFNGDWIRIVFGILMVLGY